MKSLTTPLFRCEPGVFIEPSKAVLRTAPSTGPSETLWNDIGACLAYLKPDGWRFQIHKVGNSVQMFSRSGKDWSSEFPYVVDLLQRSNSTIEAYILDCELVGFDRGGSHIGPENLRRAARFQCWVLDLLYVSGNQIAELSTTERLAWLRFLESQAFKSGLMILAEYRDVNTYEVLQSVYSECVNRKHQGFDGVILKKSAHPYFSPVIKLKTEDTLDAVVVGAYTDSHGDPKSLLVAVPIDQGLGWIPVATVAKSKVDWLPVWNECKKYLVSQRPSSIVCSVGLKHPNVWIEPMIVVEMAIEGARKSQAYAILADRARHCTLREDKGPDQATPFSYLEKLAGVTNAYTPTTAMQMWIQEKLL